jgi:molybdopterin converting factor small subunit
MIVEVKIFYYSVFGKGSLSVEFKKGNVTVQDVLSRLEEDYGKDFKKKSSRNLSESFGTYFNIFLNGEHLSIPEQAGTKLKDKDRMVILRPVSGG